MASHANLITACKHGYHERVLELLLTTDCDPHHFNNEPLKEAILNRHYKIAELLMGDPRVNCDTYSIMNILFHGLKNNDHNNRNNFHVFENLYLRQHYQLERHIDFLNVKIDMIQEDVDLIRLENEIAEGQELNNIRGETVVVQWE